MRLLTRSDFDGLACGVILKAMGIIDSWKFVHPKDMQDGTVAVTAQDVIANVPYVPGCGMWFDHHSSEITRVGDLKPALGENRPEPSVARVIYKYYDGDNKFPHLSEMVAGVDKMDAGRLTIDDIKNPKGWVMLGFIMDPRTGLGRFRDFTVSNYELMVKLLDFCNTMTIDEILKLPDVAERVALYEEQQDLFISMVQDHTKTFENVIITDLRGVTSIYSGNRFLIYCLYPEQNVSVWIVDGRGRVNCPIAVGKSIINRSCKSDIGDLMLKYGGGGHEMVGTCQVDYNTADSAIFDIVAKLVSDNRAD